MTAYLNALGIVNALGRGKQAVLGNLLAGSTAGISIHNDILVSGQTIPFGFVTAPLEPVPEALDRFASRNLALCLTALDEIDAEIREAVTRYGSHRIGVIAGTSTSGIAEGEKAVAACVRDGQIPPDYRFERQEIGTLSEAIARHYGLAGPALTISTACSSSAKSFAAAERLLRMGVADAVIVGGADAFCRMTVNGFYALSALADERCLPFSRNRQGTVLGEGAAFFLMTREPGSVQLAGAGESSDAHNMTAPDPGGRGAAAAMRMALEAAALTSDQIAYVNLHGTGTRLNDAAEALAVTDVFGLDIACSSSKPQIGHTLGAAGAIEVALCWLVLSDAHGAGQLPPHLWDGEADPELPALAFVQQGQSIPPQGPCWLMSNSYAFGGSNAAVIIGRPE